MRAVHSIAVLPLLLSLLTEVRSHDGIDLSLASDGAQLESEDEVEVKISSESETPYSRVESESLPRHQPRASTRSLSPEAILSRYKVEILLVVCLHFVALHIYFGKKSNSEVSMTWYNATAPFFRSQFSCNKIGESHILAQSWNVFECYSTGRRNCAYCLTTVDCLPRQCPWMYWLLCSLVHCADSVDLHIPLDSSMESFIFGVGRKESFSAIQKEHDDVAACASLKARKDVPWGVCVLSDNSEVADKLLTPEFLKCLNKHGDVIHHIIVSDQVASQRTPQHKAVLRARLLLPDGTSEESITENVIPILHSIFALVDSVPFVKLTEKAKIEVRKARQNHAKIKFQEQEEERAELVARKREEKALAEEAKIGKMTPAQQRKHEERQQKKQNKAMQPKIKMK